MSADMKCPKCSQEDKFRIEATVVMALDPDHTYIDSVAEWDDNSLCLCAAGPECEYSGAVWEFKEPTPRKANS